MNKIRNIGYKVDSLLRNDEDLRMQFCKTMNYSVDDLNRICSGRVCLSPIQLKRISAYFGTSILDLLNSKNDNSYKNQLHCRTPFSKQENCDMILDMIDSYIDIAEAI